MGELLLIFWRCYKPVVCLEHLIWESKRPNPQKYNFENPKSQTNIHTKNRSLSLSLSLSVRKVKAFSGAYTTHKKQKI